MDVKSSHPGLQEKQPGRSRSDGLCLGDAAAPNDPDRYAEYRRVRGSTRDLSTASTPAAPEIAAAGPTGVLSRERSDCTKSVTGITVGHGAIRREGLAPRTGIPCHITESAATAVGLRQPVERRMLAPGPLPRRPVHAWYPARIPIKTSAPCPRLTPSRSPR